MNINSELPRYKDFRPTGHDRHIVVEGIEDYIVVLSRNRDSSILDEVNFEAALKEFGGEDNDKVQVHRFGHWGCGWFELLLVAPELEEKAYGLAVALENYPVLDETAYCEALSEAVQRYWDEANMKERIHKCADEGESIFAARRDVPPASVWDRISDSMV